MFDFFLIFLYNVTKNLKGDMFMKKKILELLEKDSHLTSSMIATMLAVPTSDVETAIKELEDERIILGYKTLVNWEKTDREETTAIIELKITPQRGMGFDKVAERIYKYPQVSSVQLMSGSYDILVMVEGSNLKEVALFVSEKLAPMEEVISTATHFVLKTYKKENVIFDDAEKDDREVITL